MDEQFCSGASQISKWRCSRGNSIQGRENAGMSHLGLFTDVEVKATALYEHVKGVREGV